METGDINLSGRDLLQIVGFFAAILGVLVAGIWLAAMFRTEEDGMFAVTGGAAVLAATLIKPRIFWHHAKALALRGRIGDTATTAVYLMVAIGLILFGGLRLHHWERSFRECQRMHAEAQTTQERMHVLLHPPGPPVKALFWTYHPMACHLYRERRSF